MKTITERLKEKDWTKTVDDIDALGYARIPKVLTKKECDAFIKAYDNDNAYRKTVNMQRYRYGAGEYKYFKYPLPQIISEVRETVYPYLAPVANKWMEELNIETRFPPTHAGLKKRCHEKGQTKPTPLILKYEKDGFNCLHQDLYGEVYFPMQLVLLLNEPGEDFTGCEFVMMEQIPRAQSKAIVLQPHRGDMLIFTTNFRPEKGTRGYYRVNMKHGVSPLLSGNRHTLGIIFHDAKS
jgi:uncharacterized protein